MINMKDFLSFEHNQVFAHGESLDRPAGLNMTGSKKPIFWVAVKGIVDDWAMYCGFENDLEYLRKYGDKVHDTFEIVKVIDVTNDVLMAYRIR